MNEWLDELEGFSLRRERLYQDFPEVEDKEKLLKWLEAAYNVGFEDGKGMMNAYIVAQALNPTSLEDEVQRLIKEGWNPVGGVAVGELYGKTQYMQALVKAENDDS